MEALDKMNQETSYSTLVVLPTGGGKTYTASMWLLKNAIDKKKKILWIAHRQMLLEQAAESFQKYAYTEVVPYISSFCFRIVSGASSHERASDIRSSDNLLIVSKDSIWRNIERLDQWLRDEKELINRQILAKPIFESFYTDEEYGDSLGVDAWESIQHLDVLSDEVAKQMADSAARNKLIVETYKKNKMNTVRRFCLLLM